MIMKRAQLLISLFCAFLPFAAQAQRLPAASGDQTATLRDYAMKVLPRCPGGVTTLEPVQGGGPVNFTAYVATVRSDDKYCGTQKYLLYSPKSQQILIGSVIPIPADGRPIHMRLTDKTSELLGHKMKATVAPFPLQDGVKSVSIGRETAYGSFTYSAFIDQSETFLIVGYRGSLSTDPAKTLRDSLGVANGARRGTGKAEIIELSDFQCPTCANAHEKIEPIIQKNIGKLNYVRIDLPLFEHHEWAIPAAMGARAMQKVAPTKYWQYVDYVFKNQETIGKRKFDDVLKEFAEDQDIDFAALQKTYNSKTERQALLDQVSRAFAAGVASTPTFIVNGQIMGFGPEGAFTIDAITKAIGVPAPAKKTGK
jgi:protein-disulfide isomerase